MVSLAERDAYNKAYEKENCKWRDCRTINKSVKLCRCCHTELLPRYKFCPECGEQIE